jgi:cytochrome c oxidase assembly protein subunit 15
MGRRDALQIPSSLESLSTPGDNAALRRFAFLTAAATFVLVWAGGLVTSHEAGLSVPDWPNSYGYNMFFFPFSKWMGGIFYEHTHRLIGSVVGLLTTILALWLFGRNSRPLLRWGGIVLFLAGAVCQVIFLLLAGAVPPVTFPGTADNILLAGVGLAALGAAFVWPSCGPSAKWLRTLGVVAFAAVVAQGVLGGLRVTQLDARLGIFHATLAQLFFVLVSAIALFHTEFWRKLPARAGVDQKGLRFLFLTASALILGQLILGATMRHQHAGLAIPDFPAAYGKIWPDTDAASVLKYNQHRMDVEGYEPITAPQIVLQMAHRTMALVIFVMVGICAWLARRRLGGRDRLSRLALGWFLLIVAQIFLGAATVWTGKMADIATAHVACGALSLMTGGLITILSFRLLAAPAAQTSPAQKNQLTTLRPSSSLSP